MRAYIEQLFMAHPAACALAIVALLAWGFVAVLKTADELMELD